MDAKSKFREGWIMLLQPFKFGELTKPLQKMTILYAYSEKPIINMELDETGREKMRELSDSWESKGKTGITDMNHEYSRRLFEDEDKYDERMREAYDEIYKFHCKQENYKGEIVQCYVENQLCRFYPDEYNIISRETFEHILTCDEREYKIEVEDSKFFDMKDIRNKLFYIQSRGINKSSAMKMTSKEAKDAVIFRPQQAILEFFCREEEIY